MWNPLTEFVVWIKYMNLGSGLLGKLFLNPFWLSECNKKHTCMLLLPLEAFYLVCALESIDYSNCKNMNALRWFVKPLSIWTAPLIFHGKQRFAIVHQKWAFHENFSLRNKHFEPAATLNIIFLKKQNTRLKTEVVGGNHDILMFENPWSI